MTYNDAALRRIVARRCKEVAEEIVREIATNPNTPEDLGRLRVSYETRDRPGDQGTAIVATAPYWKYVEFGTGQGPEQPHVRPAIDYVRARRRGR